MTTATTYLHSSFWTRSHNSGASDTAQCLQRFFRDTVQALRIADTWNRIGDANLLLDEAYQECSTDNWDGYGAQPITASTYTEALAFLNALPTNIPIPEVIPEPDGSVGFEWENGPNRIFSASLNGKGTITYAGLIGKGVKAHGTEIFDDAIPQNIIAAIKRIYS